MAHIPGSHRLMIALLLFCISLRSTFASILKNDAALFFEYPQVGGYGFSPNQSHTVPRIRQKRQCLYVCPNGVCASAASDKCCTAGNGYCPSYQNCCWSLCIPLASTCCSDGSVCGAGLTCCNNGGCCTVGSICTTNSKCYNPDATTSTTTTSTTATSTPAASPTTTSEPASNTDSPTTSTSTTSTTSTTDPSSDTNQSNHDGLSRPAEIATIVGSVFGGVTVLISLFLGIRKCLQ